MAKQESATVAPSMSDAAMRARTGKTWSEWFEVLDAAGAAEIDHKGIVAYLARTHPEMGGWWHQSVTVGYEQARGKREKYQTSDGYQIGGSKSIAVPVESLFAAWTDEAVRRRWLPDAALSIRKATPHKSLRIAWEGGTSRLDVYLYEKGPGRSQVAVNHLRLPDPAAAERMKAYWKERLDGLKALLEGATAAGSDASPILSEGAHAGGTSPDDGDRGSRTARSSRSC